MKKSLSPQDLVAKLDLLLIDGESSWEEDLEGVSDQDFERLSNLATEKALQLALLSIYLGHRGGFGCGDHGHDGAIRAMNKERKKIRWALCYSYP